MFSSIAVISMFAGCGGGGSTVNVQNPQAPALTPVSITFQPAPSGSIIQSSAITLTAVVTNDPSNAGVDWAVVCSNQGNCGTISPLHTSSGSPATYTAPATTSGKSPSVTIEAFATADHTANATTSLSIVGFASNLKGNYVFQTQGIDAFGGPYQLAGVVTLDGNGSVTGGEQTHSDFVISVSDVIQGGSYTLGPDGRGTMTINTSDQNIGQLGVENFSLVFLSSSKAFIVTFDDPNLSPSGETSSGPMDLQTSTTAPDGAYAFSVYGTDTSLDPMAIGGVMNIDSPNKISGTGSVADQDLAGSLFTQATLSGKITSPDSLGSIKFTLTTNFEATPIIFTGYIIDATHIKLVEIDNDGTGTGIGATGGVAVSQGAAAGTFTNASFSGNFVFGILGQDLTAFPTSLASAGTFTADGAGNLKSGYNDEYLSGFSVAISDSFTGTYTADPSGNGRIDSNLTFKKNGPGPEFIFYLTGNGNPALILDADANIGSIGSGIAYVQADAPIPFNGPYGLYFTQGAFGGENDGSGEIDVDGSNKTLSGTVDTNFLLSPLPDTPISGTFGTIPTNGKTSGTLTNTFFPSPDNAANTIVVRYYLIDSGHGFFIETDSLTSGELLFGYFGPRTPLCQGCP